MKCEVSFKGCLKTKYMHDCMYVHIDTCMITHQHGCHSNMLVFWTITPQICNHCMIPKFIYVNLKKLTQGFVVPCAKPDVQILRHISRNHTPRSAEKYGKENSKISLDKLGNLVDRLLWNDARCILSLK